MIRPSAVWLPLLSAFVALLVALLVFLSLRFSLQEESHYFEDHRLLNQLRQLDANWERDTLKSYIGLSLNYDRLAEQMTALDSYREELAALAGHGHEEERVSKLEAAEAALQKALDEKVGLIEQFKSHNAVLRNSMIYLPSAAEELMAMGGEAVHTDLHTVVNHVLEAILESVRQTSAPVSASEIKHTLDGLESKPLPPAIRDRLGQFTGHVRTVLREQQTVSDLLGRITTVPVANRIDSLNHLLLEDQRRNELLAERYQQYLIVFSSLLVAVLFYAATALVRSDRMVRHANRQLEEANRDLEARVEVRTRKLRAAQEELVATARRAGMAEIATNVLHNVGNVINSVNVSAGLIAERVEASKSRELDRVVALLDEHGDRLGEFLEQDPKGRLLPDYLGKLSKVLASERDEILDEIKHLSRSTDHVKDIVATQQSYAGTSRILESVRLPELIDDALRMNTAALTRHDVQVVKEFVELPEVQVDRHQLLQILVNLISNAKHAITEGGDSETRRITLGLVMTGEAEQQRLCIRVTDDGCGIAAADLPKVFNHGFTTRKNGSGFGLHSCALAAKEMGGTIKAHSDGPGKGATFTLELPVHGQETQP